MPYRRVIPLDITVTSDDDCAGHHVEIADITVAYRAYDGSDTDDVQAEVAKAIGALLLGKLQEQHPVRDHGGKYHDPGSWLANVPVEDW